MSDTNMKAKDNTMTTCPTFGQIMFFSLQLNNDQVTYDTTNSSSMHT